MEGMVEEGALGMGPGCVHGGGYYSISSSGINTQVRVRLLQHGGCMGGGGGASAPAPALYSAVCPTHSRVSGRFAVLSKLSAFLPPSYKTQKMRKFRPKKWGKTHDNTDGGGEGVDYWVSISFSGMQPGPH